MSPIHPVGMPAGLDYPDALVGDILAGTARRYPERVALRDGELSLTYAELYDRALRVAQGLRERGLAAGDAVALHQPNSLWYTVSYFGVVLAGCTVAPLNPTLPPALLAQQMADAGVVAAFTHPATAPALGQAGTDALKLVVTVPPTPAAPAPQDAQPPADAVPLADLLLAEAAPATRVATDAVVHLSFTGGTTGRSKAVRVLHRNVVANVIQMNCWRSGSLPALDAHGGVVLDPVPEAQTDNTIRVGRDTFVAVAPMFHALGLVSQVGNVLNACTTVVMGRFEPTLFLELVDRHQASTMVGSPALFHALMAVPRDKEGGFPSVRSVVSGAAPIDTTTLAGMQKLFPNAWVAEGYGLTEATIGLSTGTLERDPSVPLGTVGAPVFDTEIEIRGLLGTDGALPTGEVGEIWARGPQIADGYHGAPELTAEQFRDGWLRTGDLGCFDEHGLLRIVGRAKDMLIYKGYNVYPTQLEELLSAHPAVAQVAVVGAARSDAGEIPVAYVVRTPGGSGTSAEELMAYVAERVAPYQKVRELHFLDSLPTSAAGKILKTELRKLRRGAEGA
ncbi:class I adenylate-forming enzyme family protein [Streptomyces sp. NPDC051940]|uniref:class I adenylate-forming enzyme family protein n=1 Tax=Streptomyces sp. NPDC051940 TaxID=3155675 RepID=UPI003438C11B